MEISAGRRTRKLHLGGEEAACADELHGRCPGAVLIREDGTEVPPIQVWTAEAHARSAAFYGRTFRRSLLVAGFLIFLAAYMLAIVLLGSDQPPAKWGVGIGLLGSVALLNLKLAWSSRARAAEHTAVSPARA